MTYFCTNFIQRLSSSLTHGVKSIAFKPDDETMFLVGTEEGDIHLCTTEFSSEYLMTYKSHVTPINKLVWNDFYNNLFLSCASEYRVLLWHRFNI